MRNRTVWLFRATKTRCARSRSRTKSEFNCGASIAALQMVFEKGERILPVSVIGRSHRLVIEIDDPFVLFGINRAFTRQG